MSFSDFFRVEKMELNAKNRLQELLASYGWPPECVQYDRRPNQSGGFECKVTIHAEFFSEVTGTGKAPEKIQAEIKAAEVALKQLSGVGPDWPRTMRDAQAGDALIKLAAYRAEELRSAEGASRWLQDHEKRRRARGCLRPVAGGRRRGVPRVRAPPWLEAEGDPSRGPDLAAVRDAGVAARRGQNPSGDRSSVGRMGLFVGWPEVSGSGRARCRGRYSQAEHVYGLPRQVYGR